MDMMPYAKALGPHAERLIRADGTLDLNGAERVLAPLGLTDLNAAERTLAHFRDTLDWTPISGTRLSDPLRLDPNGSQVLRANVWWAGTYPLYQRGIEYFRVGEEPGWLVGSIAGCPVPAIGGLECYRDEATGELVPVMVVPETIAL